MIGLLQSDPFLYLAIVVAVIVSITLHELAHGWAAIALGDRTPIEQQRMTLNPMVHMGPVSIVLLMLVGFAFGSMPVDPKRLRGRGGEAWVALAGPAMNLLLAIVGLSVVGVWVNLAGFWDSYHEAGQHTLANVQKFFYTFGKLNLVLMIFNLIPVPPLDGAMVLGGLSPSFKRGLDQVRQQPAIPIIALVGLLVLMHQGLGVGLFDLAERLSIGYINLVFDAGLYNTGW